VAEEAYSATVLDHFSNPRHAGVLEDADAVGVQSNPVCGDTMKLMLRIDGGTISDARWQTVGCPAAIATSSIASDMIIGRSLDEVEGLTRDEIVAAAGGLPPSKLHCSVLAQDALRRAIRSYRARTGS
jgi:nitrogen fixation NifU-like protein